MSKRTYALIVGDPVNNDGSDNDFTLLICDKIIDAIVIDIDDDPDAHSFFIENTLTKKSINYDILNGFVAKKGSSFVRHIRREPGVYHESWDTANDAVVSEFIKFIKDVKSKIEGSGSEINPEYDQIFKIVIENYRESKINKII